MGIYGRNISQYRLDIHKLRKDGNYVIAVLLLDFFPIV